MRKKKPFPIRSHPPGTPHRTCQVNRTDMYITVISDEIWGGMHFSRRGLAIHSARDVTPEWIGANVRQALETSEYCSPPPGVPIDRDHLIAMKAASSERRLAFWDDVASTYGYKSRDLAWKKKDHLFISWFNGLEPDIVMEASKSSVTGNHSAWPLDRNEGRVFRIPFAASDAEIGETVLKTLAKCEGPGKSTQPLFP
ncbi:contact-dependent growth inhibition system immunity protein [Acetobacter nitrogenifigens]|nr:contact-dependent growth inhibition system immunity protein [Acetobacter nitrogenifigens]MBO1359563.1 CdiI family contact-dependent growth inhibition immunity protein [Acetobacter sacchari]